MSVTPNLFQNILFATDFSDAATVGLEMAVKVARSCGAKLTVVHVVPEAAASLAMVDYGSVAAWVPTADDVAHLQQELREGADQQLCKLVAGVENGTVPIETDVLLGIPYASITEAVKRKGFDLVVVGTRGMSAIKRVFVGSTATRLARICPAPVLIARSGSPDETRSVLAAVDFSPVSEQVVSVSASLASALNAQLHVLHVYDTEDLHPLPAVSNELREGLKNFRRRARREAFERLEQLAELEAIDHRTAKLHVAQGSTYQAINSAARRLNAGLVVLGSVGRRGISALLIGNTAEKILHTLDRSLLVIKPRELTIKRPHTVGKSFKGRSLTQRLQDEDVALATTGNRSNSPA